MYEKYLKRLIDLILSLLGLLILWPLFITISCAIKLDSEGPVCFKQKRIGKHKTHFYILKFRTMRVDTPHDIPTHLMETPQKYTTRIGNILRKTSIDELPQIINILIGHMTIIGPRPALWNQFDLIAERDRYPNAKGITPNDVRPGLTGWAQINGRDELSIEQKAKLDGDYIQQISIGMDAKCFFGTIKSVIKGEGIV